MAHIHIKSAFDHIRRSPFQALAAVMVLSITFFVLTLLTVLLYSSEKTIAFYETRPQVIAFIKNDATPEAIASLQQKLQSDIRIENVVYVTKEQALDIYKGVTSDNPLLSELVNPSIFPASLEFSPTELSFTEEIIEELKKEEVVDQVGYTAAVGGEDALKEQLNRLRDISKYLRLGGVTFAALLATTSFLVLIIIIGMRMTQRRGEIEILDLIGATPGFIRMPIVLEAIIYVLIGAFLGWLVALLLVLYATPSIINFFGQIPVLPRNTLELLQIFALILGAELLIGLFLGLTGSAIALTRAKRRR